MEYLEKELKEIDKLFEQTKSLIEQGLDDAAYVYAEKIVDAVWRIIINAKDKTNTKWNLTNPTYTDFLLLPIYMNDEGKIITPILLEIKYKSISKYKKNYLPNLQSALSSVIEWVKVFIKNPNEYLKINELKTFIPFQVNQIDIKNFLGLSDITINENLLDANYIVFTGSNGEGKTSILQAVTIGLLNSYRGSIYDYFLEEEENFDITVGFYYDNIYFANELSNKQSSTSNSIIRGKGSILAYGPSRLQLQSAESQDDERLKQSNVHGLFRTNSILQNISYWLKHQKKERREAVKTVLIRLLPSISDIEITTHNGLLFIENGKKLKSDQLSAGNKSILAMIGDMIIRLFNAQPYTKEVADLHGIVLIDELETHLHPIWQRELPKLLATFFPKIQFIVTTHSPIVCLGMPENTVFYNVSRNKNGATEVAKIDIDITNLLPNQILTSPIFGLDNIRHLDNKGIETLEVEDTFQEIIKREESKQLLEELSKNFKFTPQQA